MYAETFRSWLSERGRTFEQTGQKRGQGPVCVVFRREGRRSEMPYAAARMDLEEEDVRQIVQDLDLPFDELSGPQSRA